ncbi:MAG: signal peptidase II [Salibaculum sp.]|uniref:signal peptidase II n=1 Tax=Salibaculum sp. TaxID=2855480 RepID=UPI0028704382|nr:signal peptidase II [Salibaculum sp.]MDR9427809.1 signal peptidase II [Salibaculum sp.]MDR9481994.1 signal peptidase II [Salibaculum sp.]
MRLLGIIAILTFVADQVLKAVVIFGVFGLRWGQVTSDPDRLPYPPRVDVVDPYLVLTMAWNRGVNFGLFGGLDLRWLLVGIALAVSVFVLWWVRRDQPGRLAMIGAGLLVGGALGNALDRVLYGAVADFLNMSCCGIANPYAFNLADIAIFAGAIGLVLFAPDNKSA